MPHEDAINKLNEYFKVAPKKRIKALLSLYVSSRQKWKIPRHLLTQ